MGEKPQGLTGVTQNKGRLKMRYINEKKALKQYDDFLDDVYDNVGIAGLAYATSEALKAIDPIAYRCGFLDWLDMEGLTIEK